MRGNRGFSLVELTVAATMSLIVIAGGFLTLTNLQLTAARQAEVNQLVGSARTTMEIIAHDVRGAGNSLELLPSNCITEPFADTDYNCPAILDPHPWQITIARNTWQAAGGGVSHSQLSDVPPDTTRPFANEPRNAVVYRFVRDGDKRTLIDGRGRQRQGFIGRIERVANPFEFAGQPAEVSVLLENVLLDDQMRHGADPATQADHRYDFSLFMYQMLTQKNLIRGSLADRTTSLGTFFLTPPLRFFVPGPPGDIEKLSPYLPDRPVASIEIVGLEPNTTPYTKLRPDATSGGMVASDPASDLRLLLDSNAIRTVRIAFKVLGPERPDIKDGIDLDGDPATGTARVYAFETTVEIKSLAMEL